MGSAAEMLTADIRAAKDLHYNTQEYLWVKAQVMAASSAAMMSKVSEATNASFDSAYTQMKKSYDEAKDDQTKKMYKDMLDNYEKQRNELKKDSAASITPAVAYNQQLIAKYDGALNAIATEMSKWEEKPGDAQKSLDEFQKGVDKAVADAKKSQ
jgi:type IV secretory pathway TrbL component